MAVDQGMTNHSQGATAPAAVPAAAAAPTGPVHGLPPPKVKAMPERARLPSKPPPFCNHSELI
eukprot:4454427-Pyramimonas_sp.AAC.1